VAKVLEHRGRNGAYILTRDADTARVRWARISEHATV